MGIAESGNHDNREYEDDWVYDRYIEVPEQIEEYAEAVLGPRGRKSIRGPKPKVLPVRPASLRSTQLRTPPAAMVKAMGRGFS